MPLETSLPLYELALQTLGLFVILAAALVVCCQIADALFAACCWLWDHVTLDKAARESARMFEIEAATWDEDDAEWERLFTSPDGAAFLDRLVHETREDIAAGRTEPLCGEQQKEAA